MQERLIFLYGEGIDEDTYDLPDPAVRARLLARSFDRQMSALQLMPREILANQIFANDPPEVWPTVKRLLASGLDRDSVFNEMALTLAQVMRTALDREQGYDVATYAKSLSRLPLPSANDVEQAMTDLAQSDQGIGVEALTARTLEQLGRDLGDEVAEYMVEHVMDSLEDQFGPLAITSGDRMVHVGALTQGIVLTHRLTEAERAVGALGTSFDLAGFSRLDDLALPDGDLVEVSSLERGHLSWTGPDRWLDQFAIGSLLAIRVDDNRVVWLEQLDEEPPVDLGLVARLRAAYDRAVSEPWLPVEAEELLLALLLEDRTTFSEPAAPLSALSDAAGLERRLDQVAHAGSVWQNETRSRRSWRLLEALELDTATTTRALWVLDVADLAAGVDMSAVPEINGPLDTPMLRAALDDLSDAEVLAAVVAELFDVEDDGTAARVEVLIDALIDAASRPAHVAIARFLAALRAERALEPLVAEQQLALAYEADREYAPAIDRLAWYASARGDARRAAQLWRRLGATDVISQDLRTVEQFEPTTHTKLGRNVACWCGSGRKYKQCHLGSLELPPLPERVGWLCRKAVGFMDRYGTEATADAIEIATARAVDPDDRDSLVEAFEDPIVMDLALTEGGWFARFLEERGALLPADEALLAQSWELVPRTVYEVLDTQPGDGVTLRDLRTGDRLDVRERTFSRETHTGALVCARAVHDGETHQFVGGLFAVAPGRESDLLDLLDEEDPLAIARWVAALHRPPVLQTREGEPMVQCDLVIEVADQTVARAFLDATYDVEDSDDAAGWTELFSLNENEDIVRARLQLVGTRLSVSTTSEERADRVLAAVERALLDATVVSDRRMPMDMNSILRRGELDRARASKSDDPAVAQLVQLPEEVELLEQIRNRFEERWCDESIPALGGITPRQAADDPSRRENLERLIASFDGLSAGSHAFTMRPEHLRELLDL